MFWKIVLVLGILGVLLGLLVTVISIVLPFVNNHVKMEEAMFGIIPGVIVLIISFLVAVLGLIFVLKNRKKPLPAQQ